MNALNQIGNQIRDILAAMTPQARIMSGLMVGVILVSLGWVVSSNGSGTTEPLLGGTFTPEELDQMQVAIGDAGLRGAYRQGRQLMIPTQEKDLYLAALKDANALPAQYGTHLDDAFSSGGMFESPLLQGLRFQTAKERELATLIQGINGIEFAAVQYDEKKTAYLRKPEQVCSIFVKGSLGREIDSQLSRAIIKQASTTFAGLTEDKISVFDQGTGRFYRGSSDPNGLDQSPYLMEQMRHEDKIRASIKEMLGYNFGDITIGVAVELDSKLSSVEEQLTYDPTPVAINTSSTTKNTENQKAAPGGPPGARENEVTTNGSASLTAGTQQSSSTSKQSEEQKNSVAGHTVSRTTQAGLVPVKVKVAVGIPDTYYKDVWERNQLEKDANADVSEGPDDTAIAKIKQDTEDQLRLALSSLPVGVKAGLEAEADVEIWWFPELPVEPLPTPGFAETAMAWFSQSWSTLGLFAILLVALGLVSSWVKGQGDAEPDKRFADGFGLKIPENLYDELSLPEEDNEEGEGRKVEFQTTGGELKEDLSTLIKDNPDVAVNLLKTWIGDAA